MKKLTPIICSVMAIIAIITGNVGSGEIDKHAKPIGMVVIDGQPIGELLVSKNALLIIGDAEGCRRDPYQCPAGLLTDGIGNTHGKIGETKTDEQIAIDWTRNIMLSQSCVISSSSFEFSQGQLDAFTSFVFNTGCHRFKYNHDGTQTKIFSLIEQGDMQGACHQLKRWIYAGGAKLAGLISRRETETALCLN